MKYIVTLYSDSIVPYHIDNSKENKNVRSNFKDSYETNEKDVCIQILKDYTDVPEYSLSDENIKKQFGDKISENSLEQIRAYYSYRKLIYGDLLKNIYDNTIGVFRYDIPYEVNHYEIYEYDIETGKQFEYYIELKISNED